MAEVLTKALSKENLAYYDTNVRPQQVKDVEVQGSQLKITKRDGSTNNLDLPSGDSFVVETEMPYATIYLTEEAIRKLGYSGFEDAELLKYRSTVGKYNIKDVANSGTFLGGSWDATPLNGLEVADGRDIYDNKYEPNFRQFKYPYTPYNTALRVNVLDEKEVSYLSTTVEYLSSIVKNKVNSMTGLEALKTRFNSVDDNGVLEVCLAIYDSNNYLKSMAKGCMKKYTVDGDDIADAISTLITDYGSDDYRFERKFTQNCIIKIAVAVTEVDGSHGGIYGSNMYSYQGLAYADPRGILQCYWGDGESYISTPSEFDSYYGEMTSQGNIVIFTQDLCTYQEFQDSIVPFSTTGLPIRVPADKIEYSDYDGDGSFIFNYYTYKLYIHKGNSFGYNVFFGQNIGDGLLIGVKNDQLTKIAVVEGDDECGETTFREVYPK